jgi:hypothetical protein
METSKKQTQQQITVGHSIGITVKATRCTKKKEGTATGKDQIEPEAAGE